MEPLKINVEVSLSQETLDTLKRCSAALCLALLRGTEEADNLAKSLIGDKSEEEATAETAKPAQDEAKSAEEVGDMPEDIAEAPAAEPRKVSDDELAAATRKAVSALKKANKPTDPIRNEVFAKYNISKSTACPPELREALLADLEAIAAQ